jgi:glycosyltransferase involved in cell wall biosynthesis
MFDASVIIPAYNASETLNEALLSIDRASERFDGEVEKIIIEDTTGKGPSWARNRGLEKARGKVVFFCDADDTVKEDFFVKPYSALMEREADMCFFTYDGGPQIPDETTRGLHEVRQKYLPAFFGYSMDDVRRWNAGEKLSLYKLPGQVWRCAFRRSFLEENSLFFNEEMTFFEDAAFLSSCIASAHSVASLSDSLYTYKPRADGNLASGWRKERNWQYKFLSLDFRRRLDAKHGGNLWKYCQASCVFSALELFKAGEDWLKYISQERVAEALDAFPLSFRHPFTAVAVQFLRIFSKKIPPRPSKGNMV